MNPSFLQAGYDMKNRLTKATLPDQTQVTFTYDALGKRISKTVSSQTTHYLWDGDELLAELDFQGSLLKSYTRNLFIVCLNGLRKESRGTNSEAFSEPLDMIAG